MRLRRRAGRLGGEGDLKAPLVRVWRLGENGDPGPVGHERRQRHAAKPRLVRLQRRRATGQSRGGQERNEANGQTAVQALRLR